jgi:hypothetical protein
VAENAINTSDYGVFFFAVLFVRTYPDTGQGVQEVVLPTDRPQGTQDYSEFLTAIYDVPIHGDIR